jgi:predicted nucleotidyltransferase
MANKSTLLAKPYPSAEEWRTIVEQFDSKAIAHKLLLSHVPYVFRDEPLKFALFRRVVADNFNVDPSSVYIVGSAMAGRSLKGHDIDKPYSTDSDIDTLIVSEHLFAKYVMESLEWVRDATNSRWDNTKKTYVVPKLNEETVTQIYRVSDNASNGIWRPDALPTHAPLRNEFFEHFSEVGLRTLGLQISEDTVANVNGRIARSFDDAVSDLADSIYRLRKEFRKIDGKAGSTSGTDTDESDGNPTGDS